MILPDEFLHEPDPPPSPKLSLQLVLGLLVAAVGVFLLLDNLQIIEGAQYLRYWPAVLVALGVARLVQARGAHGGAFGGVLLTTAGSWLLLEETRLVQLSLVHMWPAALVAAGGFLVWQGLSGPRPRPAFDEHAMVSAMAVLGSIVRGSNAASFRGGELMAVMGGCELDLRRASIDGEAVIDVFALWGGIEIRVPEDWSVVTRITPVLGGVEDKTSPPPGAVRHRLVLRGLVLMAGVEVKH